MSTRSTAPILVLASIFAAAAAQADEPVGYQTALELVQKYNCQQCHTIDKPLAGPSFSAIAKRYASNPHARSEVSAHILNGIHGAWGPLPMPPVAVAKDDLRPLVDWILSLKNT